VVPAYPALALLTGAFVARWEAEPGLISKWALGLMWGTLLLIGGGLLVIPGMVAQHLRLEIGGLWIPGVPVVLGGVMAWWSSQRQQVRQSLGVWTISTALFLVALFGWTAAEVDRGQSNVALARAMQAADPHGNCRVASWHFFRPGLIYYSGELAGVDRVERLETAEDLLAWWKANPGPTFVVARADELDRERARLPADLQEVTRVAWFMKQGHELVLLRRPGEASKTPSPVLGVGDSGTTAR
jgi:hypothetical protein